MKPESRREASRRSLLRRLTTAAVLTAGAMILSWVEAVLPFSIGIPGVKLGLCHIVTLVALYRLSLWETVALTAVRVLLTAALFGHIPSLLYSAVGAALSLAVMVLLGRLHIGDKAIFSPIGISISGAVAHNIGQLLTAAALMQTTATIVYLPVLLVAGTITGAAVGGVAAAVFRRL